MLTLKGKRGTKTVSLVTGFTIVDMALKAEVEWGFSCLRGTCSRCRCQVQEGAEFLNAPTDEELDNLGEDELEQGFRLGCQAAIRSEGDVTVAHKPYF
ncbi:MULTISPECIES: 2Fe-2S iron-sulfur cluster-binding protein [Paenibacillus]|uniref:2Fe-2S iron-sulfur cluster-binding protein n=1 Tax=Paenibacillus TaxID=44249 RepID=UPI0022B89312|nr:2Fe-2S iron-sulfur cluster-binding protein [Paenibacillus caseinilyticus]MCZ8520548.1 2Fe-2S iron-sulfur cluster-binding protein [Paenibacillus caseinilyticus]